MPFFHDQDRGGLLRHYLEAWRRHRAGLPLEPLQHQLVALIEQHPDYHGLLDDPEALAHDWTPESGQANPFLHLGLHLAIREQVATDRPPGVRTRYQALVARLRGPHEAEHVMMGWLAAGLWESQRYGRPPDEAGTSSAWSASRAASAEERELHLHPGQVDHVVLDQGVGLGADRLAVHDRSGPLDPRLAASDS